MTCIEQGWLVFIFISSNFHFQMIRRPDHRPCVDVETSASRSWLVKLVADPLRKACLLAWSHRPRNGSSVTQRHKRHAAKDAGDGHNPYVRIRFGHVQHLCPNVSCAAPPRPVFAWTVVPQGLNHGACAFHELILVCANMEPEQQGDSPIPAIVH